MNAIQSDLVEHLVGHAHLRLYYNPFAKLYSKLGESRDEFVRRVHEEALNQVQPQLKSLARRLQRQLEQLRESPLPEELPADVFEELESTRRKLISKIESKVDALILGNADALPQALSSTRAPIKVPDEIREMKEELDRIEADVLRELDSLLREQAGQAAACEEYLMRLQPTNIKVIRRALLWVLKPVRAGGTD
jgi:hypothetical protein